MSYVDAPRSHAAVADAAVSAALLAFAAGAIHLVVGEPHLGTEPAFGLALVASGVLQLAWGAAVLKWPSRGVVLAGLGVNALALLAYAVSRSVGLPIGPDPGVPGGIGALDTAVVIDEALLVLLSARYFRLRPARADWHAGGLLIRAAGIAAAISALLVVAGAGHAH